MKKIMAYGLILVMMLTAACASSKTNGNTEQKSVASDVSSEQNTSETDNSEEQSTTGAETTAEETDLLIAAASSLQYSLEELIPIFKEQYPNITVEGTYDSSGKLQTQIEEGLEADVFFSAATKQMDALMQENLIATETKVELLQNKLVLIVPADSDLGLIKFEDIVKADTIAVGDPESVPAGQYAKESLTNLGLWDEVLAKSSLGTNVTEVLTWVTAGSADAGIVYATDAMTNPNGIKVVSEAPSDSLKTQVIYPVAVLKNSDQQEAAQRFVEFLSSEEALAVFEKYGFTANK